MRKLKVKTVTIQVHPQFYDKMEQLRLQFKQNNINLSQPELTNIIAKKIKVPTINIMGVRYKKNVKIKKR